MSPSAKNNEIKNITIVMKPRVVAEFAQTIPNLTTWLSRRKKTIYFLDNEVERINKIFKGNSKNINFITIKVGSRSWLNRS